MVRFGDGTDRLFDVVEKTAEVLARVAEAGNYPVD